MGKTNSRRLFLHKCFSSVLGLAFIPVVIESCTSKKKETGKEINTAATGDPCSDYSDLSKEEIKKRETLGYVKKAPSPDKQCGNCNLWLPPVDGAACGKCQLFKGPVPAEASCIYWAPKE